MTDFLIGFLLSVGVGVIAYSKRSLNLSGVLSALVIGTLLYGFVGWFSFLMLMVFFVSSSVLSKLNPDKTSSRRTAIQVLANGGVVGVLAVVYGFNQDPLIYILILTSIAISASDTWSSEIGRLSKKLPTLIFTNKQVPKGISGGVTALGFFASFLAALLFSSLSLIVVGYVDAFIIFVFALIGSTLDSCLGIIQVKYKDTETDVLTEKVSDSTVYFSGFKWLDNNLVNFLANLGAVFLLFILVYVFIY